jgi:hypothetical protein
MRLIMNDERLQTIEQVRGSMRFMGILSSGISPGYLLPIYTICEKVIYTRLNFERD